MNIFSILSSGSACLDEYNISGFLAYLLNPAKDHYFGSSFLILFLENMNGLFSASDKKEICDGLKKQKYIARVQLEKKVLGNQCIDILVELFQKAGGTKNKKPSYAIAIKNILSDKTVLEEFELANEYNGLNAEYNKDSVKIGFVYIVPSAYENAKNCFDNLECPNKKMVFWKNEQNKDDKENIAAILDMALQFNRDGVFSRIPYTVNHTVRNFIFYVQDGFSLKRKNK